MGLVARDVLFICFVGDVSETLAARCARKIERTLTGEGRFALFMDAHSPEGGNTAARAQVVRALLSRRHRIRECVTLVRTERVQSSAKMLSEALGAPAVVTMDHDEFNRMLIEAAPQAHERIHPDNCVAAPAKSEPPLRLVRRA
jgi:hypothetical protein